MVCERTRLKKHIVIIDCAPKGQASEQMADDETTKQKTIHRTATTSKFGFTPYFSNSLLQQITKILINKLYKFFRNISCRKFHEWHLDGVITHCNPRDWSFKYDRVKNKNLQ